MSLVIHGIVGNLALTKIDQLLKEKSLIGTSGVFRVLTGTFGTPEVAKAAVKEIGFNALKGEKDNRVLYRRLYVS